ncbi:MAG TPA: sigma 54-interacting transcriptional regulator [Pyrinomonadaceae bacterium]|nr:sigma 54-interacting transcriptional regulator [Pyrinomonadaceae bacterium]
MPETRAQIILQVAQVIGTQLEMSELLASLNEALAPIIHFDAIGIGLLKGETLIPYWAHVEGVSHERGESVEGFMKRFASSLKVDPLPMELPVNQHPISEIMKSGEPYIASDLENERPFDTDEPLLKAGFRSYIDLPLIKQGELIGTIKFLSRAKANHTSQQVHLLHDISHIVAIAVANALAYEDIKALKEQLLLENRVLQEDIVQRSIYEEIIGSSRSLQKVLAAIEKVASTDSTVLISGETGTGKELVAHAIHRRSQRCERALVKVNCAALPAELIASELFGHEKGAFTGALQQRVGRFEAANGGTIFLDEIAELSPEIQVSLLRVLQEKEFERVGGNRTIKTDVRVIAATNKDLWREVSEGRFRMDLFYRLNVFPVHVPPLRERVNDIPVLVDYFASRLARRTGKKISQIEKQSLCVMQQYSWPGNIRELQNVIERCVILAEGEVLRVESGMLTPEAPTVARAPITTGFGSDRKAQIEAVLRETRGKVYGPRGAASRLGLPATTLDSQIRALGINKHQFK